MTKGAAPDASSEDPREARLQALFTAAEPTADPSEALRQRVAEMAASHEERERHRQPMTRPGGWHWTPWRLGLGLAAAAALAMIGVGLAPMWVAAHVLQRAEAAAGEVQNAHVVTWTIGPDGSRAKTREEWQQGSRSRAWDFNEDRVRLLTDGKLWVYEPKLNKVTVQNWKHAAETGTPAPTLKEGLRGSAQHGWGDIHLLFDTFVRSRRVL